MKEIKTIPAQSANFQPMAPFHPALWQSAWVPSNPFGIKTVPFLRVFLLLASCLFSLYLRVFSRRRARNMP